jgi:hypothetical protein
MEKPDISIEFVDVELRPDLVKNAEIFYSPTLLLEYKGRVQKVFAKNELSVTNGIIQVTRQKDPVIYYSIFHQEGELERSDKDGFSNLADLIRKSLFEIRPINLSQMEYLPDDMKNLMIWGPRSPFFEKEIALIEKFLQRGGRLVIGLDPSFPEDNLANLRQMLRKYGLALNNDLVVDSINYFKGSSGSIPVIKKYDNRHPITKDFKGPIFLPLAGSIEQTKEGKFTPLALTSDLPASWAEKSADEIKSGKVTFNKDQDLKGPVTVVASFEGKYKILAFGNSNFLVNGYGKFGQNFLFFLNGLNWSSDEGRLISFDIPLIKNEPVFIGPTQLGVIFYFSVIFSPLILLGISVYFYRRRLAL